MRPQDFITKKPLRKITVAARIDETLKKTLEKQARQNGVKLSCWIETCLRYATVEGKHTA